MYRKTSNQTEGPGMKGYTATEFQVSKHKKARIERAAKRLYKKSKLRKQRKTRTRRKRC